MTRQFQPPANRGNRAVSRANEPRTDRDLTR